MRGDVVNVCFLASGRGSNIPSLTEPWPDYIHRPFHPSIIVCDRLNTHAEELGYMMGMHTVVINRYENSSLSEEHFETRLSKVLKDRNIGIICLTGFRSLLTPKFVSKWRNRILNAHPSILPAFPGLDVHDKILKSGVKISGSTIHLVDEGIDTGTIIDQRAYKVTEKDTEKTLRAKSLEVESVMYPKALTRLANALNNNDPFP